MHTLGGDPLGQQILHAIGGRGEEQVGDVVGQDTIRLLWHRAIAAPEPRLHMCHPKVHFRCRDRRRQGRVHIAVHEHQVGPFARQHRFHRRHHRCGLCGVGARSDGEVVLGSRDLEIHEKRVGHGHVVVLARVHDDVFEP